MRFKNLLTNRSRNMTRTTTAADGIKNVGCGKRANGLLISINVAGWFFSGEYFPFQHCATMDLRSFSDDNQ